MRPFACIGVEARAPAPDRLVCDPRDARAAGRRGWYANLLARPEFIFHRKETTRADLHLAWRLDHDLAIAARRLKIC